MAINDEIAAGGRPIQFENPLNNMVKMFNIRNDMQTNQMNQMKMDEAQRAQAQAEDTRNFFRTPGLNIENMNPAQKQMLASKDPALFEKLMTQQSTQRTQESETNKRSAETEALHILPYAAEYGKLNNRDEAVRLTTHMYANKNLANAPFRAKTLEQAIAAIPDDTTPEGKAAFKEYASKNALGAKDYADKQLLSFAVEGGNYVGRNKYTGAVVSSSPMSMTAEQQTKFPVGFQEGTTSLDARRGNLQAKLKQLQNPNLPPEQARALENDIAQDRRSISAQEQDQESKRKDALDAAQPIGEVEKLGNDIVNWTAKGIPTTDPRIVNAKKRIAFLTTHPGQEPVDLKKVAHVTVNEKGDLINQNAYGTVLSVTKEGGKPSAQYSKAKEQARMLGQNVDIAIEQIGNAIKPGGLLDRSTGSGIGRGIDIGANLIGKATPGAIAAAELAPIADLAVKLVTRFEGSQSNADVADYKRAAGQLADPTLPIEIRRAAAVKVMDIMKRRKGQFITPEMAAQAEAPAGGGNPHAGKTDAQIKAELGI